MSNFIVLFDACVFYPAPLGDLLMQLTITDLFRAKWSPLIHEEWMASVAPDRPELSREKLEGTKERMAHVRDFLVTGIEFLIPVLSLPTPMIVMSWRLRFMRELPLSLHPILRLSGRGAMLS